MSWEGILKEPARTSGKTAISNEPKIRSKLKPIPTSTKKNCLEQLYDYRDKLENRQGIVAGKDEAADLKTSPKEPYTRLIGDERRRFNFSEKISALVTDVPEEVACKALEYLNQDHDDVKHRIFKHGGTNYLIITRVDTEFEEYPAHVFGSDFGDASVFLYIHDQTARLNRTEPLVKLLHSLVLYKDYDENTESKWANELDWR